MHQIVPVQTRKEPRNCWKCTIESIIEMFLSASLWHIHLCALLCQKSPRQRFLSIQNPEWVTTKATCFSSQRGDKASKRPDRVFPSLPLVFSTVWVGSRRRQADRLTVMSLNCNRESGVTAQTSDKTLSARKKREKENKRLTPTEARRETGVFWDDEEQEADYGSCSSNISLR